MKRIIFLYASILLFLSPAGAQQADAALARLTAQFPAEKIYIHYDKEYYVAGETIWFKAYLYSNGAPSGLSNNFYLQLINDKGRIISHAKYPVKGATIKGNIDLPDSLDQGYYHIRALTPQMLDANPGFLYSKDLFVFNPSGKKMNNTNLVKPGSVSLQFFPESGILIEEVLSVLAFKATDASGRPIDINGVIKTEDGTTITSFRTYHDGMGKLQFKPQAGKKYLAAIAVNGQTEFYSLPPVQPTGINLKIEDEKGGKLFQLTRSKKEREKFQRLHLVAEMNSRIVYENDIDFETYLSVRGHLLTDSTPSGILHFTVFTAEGVPLAERLSFVNNREYQSAADIRMIKEGTGKREENIFDIVFPDTAQRSCSVSIIDWAAAFPGENDHIISKLLLTQDLKGRINDPAWYFQPKNDSAQQGLDNLLLTQGWSRFLWENILAGKFPERKLEDPYLIPVSGELRDSKTKELVNGGTLSLFIDAEDSVNQNFETQVSTDGKFKIDSVLIYGKTKFFYSYVTPQGKEKIVDISVNSPIADTAIANLGFQPADPSHFPFAEDILPYGEGISKNPVVEKPNLMKTKELDPAVVDARSSRRPIEVVNEKYATGVFRAMGKSNFDNINEPSNDRTISVYDFIRSSVRQVQVQDNNFVSRRNFSLTNSPTQLQMDTKRKKEQEAAPGGSPGDFIDPTNTPGKQFIVAVFLNESPTDISFLKTIRMDEVALVKFYDPGFVGASSSGPGGTLAIYTKKLVVPEGKIEKLDYIIYNGYALAKQFYSPDYSIPDDRHAINDTRATLYWNPDILMGPGGRSVRLRFFNNDTGKKFKITVEGFDASGKLIHSEKIVGD